MLAELVESVLLLGVIVVTSLIILFPPPRPQFPTFHSWKALKQDPMWLGYLQAVYRDTLKETSLFPIDTSSLMFYYPALLDPSFVEAMNFSTSKCNQENELCPSSLWHFAPTDKWVRYIYQGKYCVRFPNGIPNHTKIEVLHRCCDAKRIGFWFYLAVGSGLYYDVGKSLVVQDHKDAWIKLFGSVTKPPSNLVELNHEIYVRARSIGYDSIQYIYQPLGNERWCYEIQDCRSTTLQTTSPCPDATDPITKHLFLGYEGCLPFSCSAAELVLTM